MTHTFTTRNMPANENGRNNLAGYETTCTCGFTTSSTMKTQIPSIQREHVEVMNRKPVIGYASSETAYGRTVSYPFAIKVY